MYTPKFYVYYDGPWRREYFLLTELQFLVNLQNNLYDKISDILDHLYL